MTSGKQPKKEKKTPTAEDARTHLEKAGAIYKTLSDAEKRAFLNVVAEATGLALVNMGRLEPVKEEVQKAVAECHRHRDVKRVFRRRPSPEDADTMDVDTMEVLVNPSDAEELSRMPLLCEDAGYQDGYDQGFWLGLDHGYAEGFEDGRKPFNRARQRDDTSAPKSLKFRTSTHSDKDRAIMQLGNEREESGMSWPEVAEKMSKLNPEWTYADRRKESSLTKQQIREKRGNAARSHYNRLKQRRVPLWMTMVEGRCLDDQDGSPIVRLVEEFLGCEEIGPWEVLDYVWGDSAKLNVSPAWTAWTAPLVKLREFIARKKCPAT